MLWMLWKGWRGWSYVLFYHDHESWMCVQVFVCGGLRHIKICNQMIIMIKWRRLDDFAVLRQNLCASWRSPPPQGWPLEDASTTVLTVLAMSPMASRHGPMEMVAYGSLIYDVPFHYHPKSPIYIPTPNCLSKKHLNSIACPDVLL
jgi:hypothetical protein